jgi:RHS repeat-associated protein
LINGAYRYAYDAAGNRTVRFRDTNTGDAAHTTTTAYNPSGTTRSVTDASGNVTTYAYDRLDRLISETDPFGKQTLHAYDLSGNETAQTDRLGRVTTYLYDAADRRVEERWQQTAAAPITHTIRTWLDAAGQTLGVTETDSVNPAATTAWQFTYDALGQLVKSRMAPGELVQNPLVYAPVSPGGSLSVTDRTEDWDSDGKAERYDSYSVTLAVGDQLLITASSSAFDPFVFLQKPGGKLATAFFDDNSGGGTAARLLVTADVAGSWTIGITARDENAAGVYDLSWISGNAIVPTALVEYDFSYDKSGNLISAREDQSAVAVMNGFGPAATGLGKWTNPIYDALNRVIRTRQIDTTSNAIEKVAIYAYRGDDSVATITRNAGGVGTNTVGTTANTYDGLGRLTEITHKPSAPGSAAIPYGYTFDAASRISTFTTPEGPSTLALDATDQLKSASLTKESYSYDNTGNRTGTGLVTGKGNRLLSDSTYRYGYDAEGNRTTKFIDVDKSGTLTASDTDITLSGYDQRNRLVPVSHVNAWTATQASALAAFTAQGTAVPGSDLELRYSYDYADRRIRRSMDADGIAGVGQASVSFAAYAGDVRTLEIARPNDKLVVAVATGQVIGFLGQVVERNFYGNGEDEILAVDKITWNGSTPTTSTFWTFADHQGTIRDIVSGNAADRGKLVEHRLYDSFGKVLARTANLSPGAATLPGSGVGVAFGYTGRPIDDKTGLSDYRARWYDASTGRFINEDPSGFAGGDTNLFRYVGNDPLDRVDPSGLTAKWAGGAKGSVSAAGFGAYGALASGASSPASTFTGKSDRGVPFGEFLVTKPSAAGGTGAGSESDSFGWGVAKGVGKGVAGLAVGAVVGVGIAAAAPFVGATGLAIGTGALIIGAGYGGLQLGRSVYQAYSGSEVTWTGTATGRTFTPSQRGELAGESLVGVATLGLGAAKAAMNRFGAVGASSSATVPPSNELLARYGGADQRNALLNRVREADGLSEAKGLVNAFREMKRIGYSLEDVSLAYRGKQGVDSVFSKGEVHAIVEAKAGASLSLLKTYAGGLRQGSTEYNVNRLQRYIQYGDGANNAVARQLLREAKAGDLESYAAFYRSRSLYELPLTWPSVPAIRR